MNGSRGVIVDWVDRDLVPVDDPSGINQPGAAPRRTLTGGAFGSDDWRAMAADVWADKQEAEVFPLVYFATGTQGVSVRAPRSHHPVLTEVIASQ